MQYVQYPPKQYWERLLERPSANNEFVNTVVSDILQRVKDGGDQALISLTQEIEGRIVAAITLPGSDWRFASEQISSSLKAAIDQAIKNIRCFHSAQMEPVKKIETMTGVFCWRKSLPMKRVGLYIPGGTAPLFSTLLMLAIPAQIAGCKGIYVCTPTDKNGRVHPAILYAAQQTGVTEIFTIGGAQAIGALAFGTETIPKVDKIFGPGNQYVTQAKQLVSATGVAIDMPAGPSEVAIIADEFCNPDFVAADLLSQAEHGIDSQVVLVSDSQRVIEKIQQSLNVQLAKISRNEIAIAALENSKAILVNNLEEGMELLNAYAPEHLIIACRGYESLADKVQNAGSVFLGNYAAESVGDYASGTNHTLPTNGFAKAFSGVSVDSFLKKTTFQYLTETGLRNIAPIVTEMALAEGLDAHANAIQVRIKQLNDEIN
ncbi:histidinol dehydrogenase [Taibaiella soli]|uniref:Histidinol dehydrogenase n=2 Tax=Taibaiella soli TaxID=1649169 RepID=A0A2W2BCN6_9BACT|nr:histidinol dehydrogenase [Taibaiella soli]